MKRGRGSAAVEFTALLPLIALMIAGIVEIGNGIQEALAAVIRAQATADRAVRAWNEAHAGQGLTRPCLERIDPARVVQEVSPSKQTRFAMTVPRMREEVWIVGQAICTDQ